MAPKKEAKSGVPIQPVPEKRGYEFGGPYVLQPLLLVLVADIVLIDLVLRELFSVCPS